MTIVKVQRPITSNVGAAMWLIYDQLRARECLMYERDMPKRIVEEMNKHARNSSLFFRAFYEEAEWDSLLETWDLTKAKLTHTRKW